MALKVYRVPRWGVSQDFTSLTSRFGSWRAPKTPHVLAGLPGREVTQRAPSVWLCRLRRRGCGSGAALSRAKDTNHVTMITQRVAETGVERSCHAVHGVVAASFMPFYKSV